MVREKLPRTVVTFKTTTAAMAAEAAAKEFNIPGRIIPIPTQISAGCGLAWRAELDQRDEVEAAFIEHGLAFEGIYTADLY